MKRQQNAAPPRDFRNRAHDLYNEVQDTQADEKEELTTMDIVEGVQLRKEQYEQSRNLVENQEETGRDSEDDEVYESVAGKHTSQNILARNDTDKNVELSDFTILGIVGRGTFGKVYQVFHIKTKKVYAMKSIRKDCVLEHQSLDSLKREQEILFNVKHPFIVSMEYVI